MAVGGSADGLPEAEGVRRRQARQKRQKRTETGKCGFANVRVYIVEV